MSPVELPYFEGDFWPNVLEDCIREVDAEEAERKREIEAQAQADMLDDLDDETFEVGLEERMLWPSWWSG